MYDIKTLVMKITIEDWYLQESEDFATIKECEWTENKYVDNCKGQTHYRLVGTKEQIRQWSSKQDFILDEVYTYEPFDKKHTYFKDICFSDKYEHLPTRQEYNKKFYKTLKEYSKMYKENQNKLLVLSTN